MSRRAAVVALVIFAAAAALAAKQFVMPRAQNASTYSLHDVHASENVGIAVDPYDSPEQRAIFAVKYEENGLLPVFFVVTNNGDQPVQLASMRVQLVTGKRTKIEPSDTDEIKRRISRTKHRGDESNRTKLPIPLPRSGPKVGVDKAASEEIDAAQFKAMAVEPHTTRAGFLFFDIAGETAPLVGAHFYVTGVKNARGEDLMFFDVPLGNSPPKP